MKVHPVAEMFPEMLEGSQEFFDLVESIRASGQVDPIVRDGETLLDGRNRLRACEKLNLRPRWVEWATLGIKIDQAEWIAAKNLDRRHLTPDQKATIGLEVEGWIFKQMAEAQKARTSKAAPRNEKGQVQPVRVKTPEPDYSETRTRAKVAVKAGVSEHKVRQAQQLSNAVANGELPQAVKDAVKAGIVKLVDAVKPIRKKRSNPKPLKCEQSIVERSFEKFMARFAPSDRMNVKKIIKGIIEA